MSNEPKSLFDLLYKTVKASIPKSKINFTYSEIDDENMDDSEAVSARALLQAIGTWAGKGKDEIVQIMAREVGVAVAAMLKEPVTQILENRRLQITLDLVTKEPSKPAAAKKKTTKTKSGQKRA